MNTKIAVIYNDEPKLCEYIKQHQDIYIPVLAGHIWSKKDYDIPNIVYDDRGDNISWLNPYVNEITAIYWLGRHLDMIGNPDYIGLQHYRRLFNLDDVLPYLDQNTLILNKESIMLPTVDFLELCHSLGRYLCQMAKYLFDFNDQEVRRLFSEFMFSRTYYSRNLFVIPSKVLVNLSQYIYDILTCLACDINFDMLGTQSARNIGFVMERLVGFYFMLLERQKHYNVHATTFFYVNEKELK